MRTAMSKAELRRAGVMSRVEAGELKLMDAAALMGVCYRQVLRIGKRYREEGAKGLTHRNAGRRSNRSTGAAVRGRALALIREKYGGSIDGRFGPTLAAEHLAPRTSSSSITKHWGAGCSPPGSGAAPGNAVRTAGVGSAKRTSGNWCSSMAASMSGLKSAAPRAAC